MGFAAPVAIVWFREMVEASVFIVFVVQNIKKDVNIDLDEKVAQWMEVACGVMVGMSIGAIAGGLVVGLPQVSGPIDGRKEELLEGILSILVSIFITLTGPHILRSGQDAPRAADPENSPVGVVDRIRLSAAGFVTSFLSRPADVGHWLERIATSHNFWITSVMLLRELLEGVIFTWAIAVDLPLPDRLAGGFTGAIAGIVVGSILYNFDHLKKVPIFGWLRGKRILIMYLCVVYLMAAGLWSRGIWTLEHAEWIRVAGKQVEESGSGPGSYDIRQSVWHDNCDPSGNAGCALFSALVGWTNSATNHSVGWYFFYWVLTVLFFRWRYIRRRDKIQTGQVLTGNP